jgi:hypothetical protein
MTNVCILSASLAIPNGAIAADVREGSNGNEINVLEAEWLRCHESLSGKSTWLGPRSQLEMKVRGKGRSTSFIAGASHVFLSN